MGEIIAVKDGAMSAESRITALSCPAAPQILLAETRRPPFATNQIIYDVTV